MYKFLQCIALLLFFFFISCSSEKPAEIAQKYPELGSTVVSETSQARFPASSESYSLELTPIDASRNSTLHLIARGLNLSDAKIEWLLNGQPNWDPISSQFNAKEAKKGDKVQVRGIINGKEIMSNIIEIKNAPPEIAKVKILPEIFKPGDTLYADVSGNDIDGDEVSIALEWTKNGEPAGNDEKLPLQVKRGDKISIKVTPFDGEIHGHPVIIHREVQNTPPMIIEDRKINFDGNIYTYQVKATDLDGDALTYSLKVAPKDMTIDSSTGLIQWNIPQDFEGKITFTVSVTDNNGGEASQSFTFEIITKAKR